MKFFPPKTIASFFSRYVSSLYKNRVIEVKVGQVRITLQIPAIPENILHFLLNEAKFRNMKQLFGINAT